MIQPNSINLQSFTKMTCVPLMYVQNQLISLIMTVKKSAVVSTEVHKISWNSHDKFNVEICKIKNYILGKKNNI